MDRTPKYTRETGTPEPKDPWEWGTGKPKGETITVGGKEHVIVSAKAKGSAKGKPGAKARARKAYMQQKRALRAMKSAEKLRIKHSKESPQTHNSDERRSPTGTDMHELSATFAQLSATFDDETASEVCANSTASTHRGIQDVATHVEGEGRTERSTDVCEQAYVESPTGLCLSITPSSMSSEHIQAYSNMHTNKHADSRVPLMSTDPLNKFARRRVAALARAHGLLAEDGSKHGIPSNKQQQRMLVFAAPERHGVQATTDEAGVARLLEQWDAYVEGKGSLDVAQRVHAHKAGCAERKARERHVVKTSMKTIRAERKRNAKQWLHPALENGDTNTNTATSNNNNNNNNNHHGVRGDEGNDSQTAASNSDHDDLGDSQLSTSPALWTTHTTGFGLKMLAKMGWTKGEGLGKEKAGMAYPMLTRGNAGRSGLGS